MPIERRPTIFEEAQYFVPVVHADARGFFKQTFSVRNYAEFGICDTFVEDSVSFSSRNVLRGLHYDFRLAKFVQVLAGNVFDVIVDIRPASATYGRWQSFDLSEENHAQLYVPKGFAHGFLALTDGVVFTYKQSAHYDPRCEGQIRWNDPSIGITWPVCGKPLLSEKDRNAPFLDTLEPELRANRGQPAADG